MLLYTIYKTGMASYISPKNQEMLWNTIKKNPLFNQLAQEQQPIWFRDIIGNFYSENNKKTLNKTQLLELNKSTIRLMIHNLKRMTGGSLQPDEASNNPFGEPIQDRIQPRSDSYKGEYENLQNEYNTMYQRAPPAEPEFKEPVDDGAIKNMDELIQQQIEERKFETIQMPKPPVQLESVSPTIQMTVAEVDEIAKLKKQIELLLNRTETLENDITTIKSQMTSVDVSGQMIHQMSID